MIASLPEAWCDLCLIRTVLRVMVTIEPTFQWRDASHGGSMQARPPCPCCLCMKQGTLYKALFWPISCASPLSGWKPVSNLPLAKHEGRCRTTLVQSPYQHRWMTGSGAVMPGAWSR